MLRLVPVNHIAQLFSSNKDAFEQWIKQLPTATGPLEKHRDQNMNEAVCCQLANDHLTCVALAADGFSGVPGTLKAIGSYFSWGAKRSIYLCDAVKDRRDLDCGAMATASLEMLAKCSDVIKGSILPISVSIIARCAEQEREIWTKKFEQEGRWCNWIHEEFYYHECVGILGKSADNNDKKFLKAAVWNYDHWLIPGIDLTAQGAILAWRFSSDTDTEITFNEYSVPTNRWFGIAAATNQHALSHPLKEKLVHMPTVFIFGTAINGENPSAGVGVARSLRMGLKDTVQLIAVENSPDSAGLHDPVFNDVVLRTLTPDDPMMHLKNILALLIMYPRSVYISNQDVDVHLLATLMEDFSDAANFKDREMQSKALFQRILIMPKLALSETVKPVCASDRMLEFDVSPFLAQKSGESDGTFLTRVMPFLNEYSYPVYVKGKYHDAVLANSLLEVKKAVTRLRALWHDEVYVQKPTYGFEESIMFAAFQGELLGATQMRKTVVTSLGKTWSAQLSRLTDETWKNLSKVLRELNWTGGGEIEYVRTLTNQCQVMDWNPRFPAWQNGASLEMVNLPTLLVCRAFKALFALDLQFDRPVQGYNSSFVRTIVEIPCKGIQPVILRGPEFLSANVIQSHKPRDLESKEASTRVTQHPSRNITMASILSEYMNTHHSVAGASAPNDDYWLLTLPARIEWVTPYRFTDPTELEKSMQLFKAALLAAVGSYKFEVMCAISVKTQPSRDMLLAALKCGYVPEVISGAELDFAIETGFPQNNIILNGPAKHWRRQTKDGSEPHLQLGMVFADSVAEFEFLAKKCNKVKFASVVGARLAMPGTASRFGVDVTDQSAMQKLAAAIRSLPTNQEIGFHFHYASSELGLRAWSALCRVFVAACSALCGMTQRLPVVLDLGGGFRPIRSESDKSNLICQLSSVFNEIKSQLPNVVTVVVEPGKAILQDTTVLISTVQQVREMTIHQSQLGKREETIKKCSDDSTMAVVVDACVADVRSFGLDMDMPLYYAKMPTSDLEPLHWAKLDNDGSSALLGRICMESDILAVGLRLPDSIAAGDFVAICSAGAYGTSMSYYFGEGKHC